MAFVLVLALSRALLQVLTNVRTDAGLIPGTGIACVTTLWASKMCFIARVESGGLSRVLAHL